MAISETTAQTETAEPTADTRLTIVRTFEAPQKAVFEAWTVPEQVMRWWGPDGVHVPELKMDVRKGGAWRMVMRGSQGDNFVSGSYREISPPDRLVFTFAWETDGERGHETVITIQLRDLGGRTELTLTQEAFETAESRDNHGIGWNSSFGCLDAFLAETT